MVNDVAVCPSGHEATLMQDRYVGDVGDFGKYGLLGSLCGKDEYGAALRLGVLWYRFDGKDTSNDGGAH